VVVRLVDSAQGRGPFVHLEGLGIVTTAVKTPGTQTTGLAHRFADYALNFDADKIPQAVLDEAKRRIIDSLGCAMGAIDSAPAKISRALATAVSTSAGGATVIGTTHQTTPDLAAFANGILFRYLDFNDTYLSKEPAHPSDNISAILAVAEAYGATPKKILAAIVLAYEIQCRLCDACSIRARGWDHVTYGPFSTALAAGYLLGFNREQYVHALGLAGTPNNAVRQTRVGELSNWKGCAFANAARNGVFAAMLAKNGMTGPSEIFEGEMGFFNQVAGGPFEVATMGGESGNYNADDFMIVKTYVKHFSAEYHSQSAIEAALILREQLGGNWQSIESITIESFNAAVEIIAGFKEHWAPTSRETADHSMPYITAATLMDGKLDLDSFTPERIHDPVLRELIQKVKVILSDEMSAGYPDGIPNRITIKTTDGKTLVEENRYPLGHAKNPMNNDQIEAKFRPLAERVFAKDKVDTILKTLWAFGQTESANSVTALLSVFSRSA